MTEADWLEATRPNRMLDVLERLSRRSRRPIPVRPLRFFALSCCRIAWPTMVDERSRNVVAVAEDAMVGAASPGRLSAAIEDADAAREAAAAARAAITDRPETRPDRTTLVLSMSASIAAHVAHFVAADGFYDGIISHVKDAAAFRDLPAGRHRTQEILAEMCLSLRDIFGNPFRPVTADPSWLTSTVAALARGIYADRAFDLLPILADALQDAGCDHAGVLTHCRGPGPHVRGCWVVDLVLGPS